MDYYNYMLEMEMERIESLENAIEADSAEVEQLPEVEININWENIPWENFQHGQSITNVNIQLPRHRSAGGGETIAQRQVHMVQRKNEGIQKSFRAIAKKASDNPQQQTRQGKGIAVNKLQIP